MFHNKKMIKKIYGWLYARILLNYVLHMKNLGKCEQNGKQKACCIYM